MKPCIEEHRSGPAVRLLACAAVFVSISAAVASGCSRSEAVTADSLAAAKSAWTRAGIRDYQLEWEASGNRNVHYVVTVRDGEVTRIVSLTPDGKEVPARPAEPRFYSVDGLFSTIADELAQLKTDRPFGQPPQTQVVMRVQFDPRLGYPISYRRDVLGAAQGLAIDVIRLTPAPGSAPPDDAPKG